MLRPEKSRILRGAVEIATTTAENRAIFVHLLDGKRNPTIGGFAKGWFPKGWFWPMFPGTKNRNEGTFGCSPVPQNGTKVHSDVSQYQKPERRHILRMSPVPKSGTKVHSPKPPFYKNRPFTRPLKRSLNVRARQASQDVPNW